VAVAAILVAEVAVLAIVAWTARSGPMAGVVVRSGDASIVMSDQRNVIHDVLVSSVLAPTDGWLVVQADPGNRVPGAILGSMWVPKGRSNGVRIELDSKTTLTDRIFVTLLADKGRPQVLEYAAASGSAAASGMGSVPSTGGNMGTGSSADVPVIAGGRLVVAHVALSRLTFAVGPGQAVLTEATRTVDATSVVIPRVVAPAQSWVSVSIETTNGQVGRALGETLVRSGEQTGVVVAIGTPQRSAPLVATLHVDLGTLGQFEYSPPDVANSPDQPYVAGEQTVSVPIHLAK
jgi:hypothetical protein